MIADAILLFIKNEPGIKLNDLLRRMIPKHGMSTSAQALMELISEKRVELDVDRRLYVAD